MEAAIIGLGDYGINVMEAFSNKPSLEADTMVVHTNVVHLDKSKAEQNFSSFEDIQKQLGSYDTVILLAGLGGNVSTPLSISLTEHLKNEGKQVLGFFTLPYAFEGKKRIQYAEDTLEKLKGMLDAYGVIDNRSQKNFLLQSTFKLSVSDLLSEVDNCFYQAIADILKTDTQDKKILDFLITAQTAKFSSIAV